MTGKEVKEKLLEALDLKIGDKIKIIINGDIKHFEINTDDFGIIGLHDKSNPDCKYGYTLRLLLECGFEKAETTRIGDRKCQDMLCDKCPLNSLNCINSLYSSNEINLFKVLKETKLETNMPKEVYKAYRKILNQEVEE